MIWHDKQLVFIHIPKCGGTSINAVKNYDYSGKVYRVNNKDHVYKTWHGGMQFLHERYVGRNQDIQVVHNMHATYDQYAFTLRGYDYISQVRNPYTRFASAWKHLRSIDLVTTEFEQWAPSAIDAISHGEWAATLDKPNIYINYLMYSPQFDGSLLFKPQWHWVREDVEIHKLEEKTIWKRLGIEEARFNVSNEKYKVTWNQEILDLIYKFYEKDFRQFGYSKQFSI